MRAFRNLWFHTGDRFYRHHNGEFVFFDRLTDTIRRRGENISSAELESLVLPHDSILECAAVAVSSEHSEDEVKICVVLKPGHTLTAEELVAVMKDQRTPRYASRPRPGNGRPYA